MFGNSPFAPAVDYLRLTLSTRFAEARSRDREQDREQDADRGADRGADQDREKGASVVEWVVITTIVVVLAVTIGLIITTALNKKATDIQGCINTAGQQSGDCNGN